MKKILFLLGMAWAVHSPAAEAAASRSRVAPAPLYRDPVHDGAADATLIWNRAEKCWWMLYTNRRADADDEKGVKWVHGTDIGITSTPDGGLTWTYRGIARGLEFETNGGRNTFWAPEVVDFGGRYHAFISYVRGVPETWKGTRETAHMFGLAHCIYFDCVMNGSNHLGESDRRPLHLCPVCLRKLQWSIGFDVVKRYEALRQFYGTVGFSDEENWADRRLNKLRVAAGK